LLSGKKTKSRDEMTLQDLFKDYYGKVKSADSKEFVNSAKTSLNSFSSMLEKKRQAAMQKASKEAEEKKEEAK
jgi:hypothetical protein